MPALAGGVAALRPAPSQERRDHRVSLGFPHPQLSSAQSPLGAVGKRRSWMGPRPGSTAPPRPHGSQPLTLQPQLLTPASHREVFSHKNPPCWC